jgi:glycerol-3-phosphate dehydrogenase
VAGLADDRFFSLHFRKGVDCILDKKTGGLISHIMAMPRLMQAKEKTKGGGLVLTIEGNILVGPTADEVPFRDVYETEPEDIERLIHHFDLVPKLSLSDVISYFSGVRPCTYDEDFIVAPSDRVETSYTSQAYRAGARLCPCHSGGCRFHGEEHPRGGRPESRSQSQLRSEAETSRSHGGAEP